MANQYTDSRADLQISDDQPHGLQIIVPEGTLDAEVTVQISNSMASQNEN